MSLSRRTLLKSAAASVMLPRIAVADTPLSGGTLTTLSDGHLTLPKDFFFSALPQDELASILAANGITGDVLEPPCNVTLYRDGTNTVLFDTGAGSEFQPTAGALLGSLDAIGLAPEDITHIIFTHAHPDHLWGLLDDFGDPLFTEASYFIGRAEWDYWTNPATIDTIGAARQALAVGAARRLAMIEDNVAFFDDADTLVSGVTAAATFGHTPGHMGFLIGEGADGAFIAGDSIGNAHVSFARPDWAIGSDQDPEAAASTRVRLMDMLAVDETLLVGFHLPNGGIGRVARSETGFQFVEKDA